MSRSNVVKRDGPSGSPVTWSSTLSRRIRADSIETLGVSTQTLAEQAVDDGRWDVAADLAEYFLDEMTRMNDALYTWLTVILSACFYPSGREDCSRAKAVIQAMQGFGPGDGDLAAVLDACGKRKPETVRNRVELMRIRVAAVHDHLVWWIQHLLTDIACRHGEEKVLEVVLRAYEDLWKVRYATWPSMTPLERLQISVEGMRGHLSGRRHRGDVGIVDEGDRYTMILDPCGSCGVLRRGDPDSGRPGCNPRGTTRPHPWAWNRIGLGWYAVHSPIVMEWLPMRAGDPPLRPLQGCDQDGPCRWYIYKNPSSARPEHYRNMGFSPPTTSGGRTTPVQAADPG